MYTRITVAAGILWTLLALAVCVSSGARADENMASVSTGVAYDIPDVTLINTEGEPVSLREELTLDRPVFVNFVFTSCSSFCPLLTATLAKVQTELLDRKEAFRIVSISIDPEQDTPARLQAYAQRFHAQPEWHFLTGNAENMLAVLRAFDAYRGGKMNHAALTLMRFPRDGGWTRFEGLINAETLVHEFSQNSDTKL
jgi:protein SCO1/2